MKIRNKTTGEEFTSTVFNGEHELVTLDGNGVHHITMRGTSFEIALGTVILVADDGHISLQHPSVMGDYEDVPEA